MLSPHEIVVNAEAANVKNKLLRPAIQFGVAGTTLDSRPPQ